LSFNLQALRKIRGRSVVSLEQTCSHERRARSPACSDFRSWHLSPRGCLRRSHPRWSN